MRRERTKRFCLLALGSRGDVQPFVALGAGLRERGHEVVIAAAEDYAPLVTAENLTFVPLVGRIAELMDRKAVGNALDGGFLDGLRLALRLRADVIPLMDRLFADTLAAAKGSNVLVASTLGLHIAPSVGEALGGIPVVAAHFHPYAPSRYYANMFFADRGANATTYNLLTHRLGVGGFWHLLRPALNRARRRALNLPPLGVAALNRFLRDDVRNGLHLHAYSPAFAPPPPDWNPCRHIVTGYWNGSPPQSWQPPADLAAFLDAGPLPVYVGFGSILAGRDPDRMTRLLVSALEAANVRGVLYRGWGDVGNVPLPPTVFATDGAYHDWLFRRCSVVVHHGGAGTTAAALRSRIPAVAVPVFGDQHFWARRLHASGASPAPLPRATLTAESLAQAIMRAHTEPSYRAHTGKVGDMIAADKGIEHTIELLEAM